MKVPLGAVLSPVADHVTCLEGTKASAAAQRGTGRRLPKQTNRRDIRALAGIEAHALTQSQTRKVPTSYPVTLACDESAASSSSLLR